MKETQLSFQRYEKKYLMTAEKYERLWQRLREHLRPDEYFSSTVCSVYYDTADYELIRRSIQKPIYKEKLRLRSYGVPKDDRLVFVELKKKFKGIVYKRRIELEEQAAERWLNGGPAPDDSQISREIDWVLHRYELSPKIMICCDREAWVDIENPNLRFTFDKNIRYREDELKLSLGSHGRLLPPASTSPLVGSTRSWLRSSSACRPVTCSGIRMTAESCAPCPSTVQTTSAV